MFRIKIKQQDSPKDILLKSNMVEVLNTIKGDDGADGMSAYQIWLSMGNTGTETDFISSLKGADGKNGTDGTQGADGKSAYESWLSMGNTGSEADFITSLKGEKGEKGQDGKDADQTQLNIISKQLADLEADVAFKEIRFTSARTSAGTQEKGSVAEEVVVSWQTNITPKELTLNRMCNGSGEYIILSPTDTQYTDKVKNIDTTTNYFLTAKDKRGATATISTAANFYCGVYYGVVTAGAQADDALLETLTKDLSPDREVTFTRTAGENQHIAFALPTAYGTPVFMDADTNIGAGFYMAREFLHTNKSGHKEMYQLWLSTNPKLGTIKIAVS